ncbi:hypothetical protein BGP75_21900 [Motiliproteus sp. MSK22-1]|nr:hypothetical protein BGP75_21900 [Motiliproteus sp. MSK22-1]
MAGSLRVIKAAWAVLTDNRIAAHIPIIVFNTVFSFDATEISADFGRKLLQQVSFQKTNNLIIQQVNTKQC